MTGSRNDGARGRLPELFALAVVLARTGALPPGALEAMTEAGGAVLVIGDGAARAAATARSASRVWWCDTGPGLQAGRLADRLGPIVAGIPLLVLPGTPDGRDLAPRLAARLGRPLLANACRTTATGTVSDGVAFTGPVSAGPVSAGPVSADAVSGGAAFTGIEVRADLCRLDDRIIVPVEAHGPAVVTIAPGTGTIGQPAVPVAVEPIELPEAAGEAADVTVLAVLEPDPSTMELAEAPLVFGGGAGLAAGLEPPTAQDAFALLGRVASALGASVGATRVATDAGWIGHDRQIGTTGVTIAARLYVAFGVSGATQHTGGLRSPERIVSVNTDAHCPMTAMSSLGIVADARGTLAQLADRLGVEVPAEVRDAR